MLLAAVRFHRDLIARTENGKHRLFAPESFPWVAGFEQNWALIREEAIRLLPAVEILMNESNKLPGSRVYVNDPASWKVFFLYGAAKRVAANCQRCPNTARFCETVPGLLHAFFSILKPASHIVPHRALDGGRLRYQIALKVPLPVGATRLRVGPHIIPWVEGRSLVFDDTFEHEAWNDSDQDRIILIIDFLRNLPRFNGMNKTFVRCMMRQLEKDARSSIENWEEDYGHQLDKQLHRLNDL